MKNGELLALAQLIVPELTAKAFVQFYNIAFEKISREVRLRTITFKPTTVSQYENILNLIAVKIDSVKDTSGDDVYWEVKHRKLLIYDSNRELITNETV